MKYNLFFLLFCSNYLAGQQQFGSGYSQLYIENNVNLPYGETLQDHLKNNSDLDFLNWKIHSKPTQKSTKNRKRKAANVLYFKRKSSKINYISLLFSDFKDNYETYSVLGRIS